MLTFVSVQCIITKSVVKQKSTRNFGIIAQLGEHLPYKQGVTGSSPVGPIFAKENYLKAKEGSLKLAKANFKYVGISGEILNQGEIA